MSRLAVLVICSLLVGCAGIEGAGEFMSGVGDLVKPLARGAETVYRKASPPGLAAIGNLETVVRTYQTTEPAIFGGREQYQRYLLAKFYMAKIEATPASMWKDRAKWAPEQPYATDPTNRGSLAGARSLLNSGDTGVAFVSTDECLYWGNQIFKTHRLTFEVPAYNGSTVVKVVHKEGGATWAQVTESGLDCSISGMANRIRISNGDAKLEQSCRVVPVFVTYYVVSQNGLVAGQMFAPEFLPNKPVWAFLGKVAGQISDEGLADWLHSQTMALNKKNMVIQAAKDKGFCDVAGADGGNLYCRRLSGDDKTLFNARLQRGPESTASFLANLDDAKFQSEPTSTATVAGQPQTPAARRELSW